uniref:DUF4806 domain-containing protein n=1 Tax=Clytia hemisphaerica TaxID=252671 RepID=A0A7M5TZ99_9CNID
KKPDSESRSARSRSVSATRKRIMPDNNIDDSPVRKKPDSESRLCNNTLNKEIYQKQLSTTRPRPVPQHSAYGCESDETNKSLLDDHQSGYKKSKSSCQKVQKRTHSPMSNFIDFVSSPRRSPRLKQNVSRARKSLGFDSRHQSREKEGTQERPSSSKNKDQYPLSEAAFQRKMVKLLLDIKSEIRKNNRQHAENLYNRGAPAKCTTIEQLLQFEKKLDNQEEYNKLIDLFMTVGGKDLRLVIRRMLQLITTNEVLSCINWDGNGDKISFNKKLKNIFQALVACASQKFRTTQEDVKTKLQLVLKDAPDREGGLRWAEKQRRKSS